MEYNMKTSSTLLAAGAAVGLLLLLKRNKSIDGIGSVERIKRRIYKEISLAQNAGIDFNKDYSELTDEEIATLEELGHNASWEQKEQKPYAQAYYESLSKAYNAISGVGIGSAYDIRDKNGNVILTWIEDAAAHVAREREIEEARKRTLEAEERAAAARKKKNSTQRKLQQMSLFGTGYDPEIEHELWEIWREKLENEETNWDYDTWRAKVGDDYARAYVLPYM